MRKPQAEQLTAREILGTLGQHRDELRARGVRKMGLFGSYSRGEARRDSDIDILVTLERPSFHGYMDLKFLLEDLFDRKVDLVLETSLKPRLQPYVLQEVMYVPGL